MVPVCLLMAAMSPSTADGGEYQSALPPAEQQQIARDTAGVAGSLAAGVLNGRAISLPQPRYPARGRAARATGTVTVRVLVDEAGRVISAEAVSGHRLLREAAVAAAYQARFSPTQLSGQPVKVSGVITYNFVLQ